MTNLIQATSGGMPLIGGAEVITLTRPAPSDTATPVFTAAQILPGRAMMVLQVRALVPGIGETDVLSSRSVEEASRELTGSGPDITGNASFSFGAAILAPYANRIRGRYDPSTQTIATDIVVDGARRRVTLPSNGGGKHPGAEQYAIHGLILNRPADEVRRTTSAEADIVRAVIRAGDFAGQWVSATELRFRTTLRTDTFELSVVATNVGATSLPLGIGWHPYFAIPSGRREQVRVHLPARQRVLVNNYDEVLPTGQLAPVKGAMWDCSDPAGATLGTTYLDDCFVDLEKSPEGHTVSTILDPAAAYALRIVATSPHVKALQTYAPPDRPFIVVEPQFNWANPFGAEWPEGTETGMVHLSPGESVTYSVRLEIFVPSVDVA